ncbi:MAG: DUF2933 domain-containing protein [Pseudomonadota bacterium]
MADQDHSHRTPPQSVGFWKSRTGLVLIVFLVVGGALLAFEHRAHLFVGSGPLVLLLLLCVGMHFFMHWGHGGHGGGGKK